MAGEQRRGPRVEVRVAREADVERLELPCGLEQQQRSLAAALLGERDLGPEEIHAGPPELVERSGLRGRQQPVRHVERPRPEAGLGGCERPFGAPRGIAGQRDRTLQERGRGGEAAARLRPDGRAFELRSDLLVRSCRRSSQMPRSAVRIDVPIGRLRQREMGGPAFLHRRRPVDGGACQRVTEGHALPDRQQPVRLHVSGDRRLDAECFGRAPQQQRIAERLRRRQQRQTPRVVGERLELADEALLDPSREALRAQQAEAARQLRRRQASRQLQQRQRIPPRLGDDPIPDSLVQVEAHRRAEQRAGVPVAHAVHLQLGDVLELLARLARGEHDPDRLRQQAAGDEGERQRRRVIEPLRVIDDTQQRTLSAASENRLKTAKPARNRSTAAPALSPNAISSAWRCGAGSRGS